MYRIYRKIPDPFQGDFEFCLKNRYIFEEFRSILWLISWSLPDDEGGMLLKQFVGMIWKNLMLVSPPSVSHISFQDFVI